MTFSIGQVGAPQLTVTSPSNGSLNADYTTTKLYVDEVAGLRPAVDDLDGAGVWLSCADPLLAVGFSDRLGQLLLLELTYPPGVLLFVGEHDAVAQADDLS